MAINDITSSILTHELQLDEKLNECVHAERRSDFSFMLAMLAEDVREHSQFKLPQTSDTLNDNSESQLRKRLQLPDKVDLALKSVDELKAFNQAELIQQQQLAQVKLLDALKPKALAFRDNCQHIPTDVFSNTSVHCQHKLQALETEIPTRLAFNAKEWIATVQSSIEKPNLISVT